MGVVNKDDLDWTETDRDGAGWRRKRLGAAAGGEALGCSLYELPAGKRSWPYHFHTANEEALFVLAGTGSVRLDDGPVALEPGDYVALAAGEAGAHRVVNEGDGPLRYLMVSTMVEPEVTVYPDSGKVGTFAGSPPGGDGERVVSAFFRLDDAVDYWDGEG